MSQLCRWIQAHSWSEENREFDDAMTHGTNANALRSRFCISALLRTWFAAAIDPGRSVDLYLGNGAVLQLLNDERDADCLIGFRDTPWHVHDDIGFIDGSGNTLDMSYPDIIVGLSDGTLLVAEQYLGGRLVDRWLIHKAYNDEFEYIEEGEHIIVRRAYKTVESAARIH